MMKACTLSVLSMMLLVGCGFVQDDDNRDQLHGLSGDFITGYEDEVCHYPSPLSGAHFAVDLRGCHKIEGGQLGIPQFLDLNGGVEIDGWQNKDGEGEYIGFEVTGDVVVIVKAGLDLFEAGAGTWVHPAGTTGPAAKGISFIAFCEPQGEPICTPTDGNSTPGEPRLGEPTDSTTTTPSDPTGPSDGAESTPTGSTTGCAVSECVVGAGTCASGQACYNGCCLFL